MPGSLLDLFASAMGRPDPSMQLAAALGRAPGQPGSNTGPIPGAPPGAGAAPGSGPSGAPPSPGGPPAGPPGAPGGAPAAPPQPQAYQSPPDLQQQYNQLAQPNLGQLMMQMYQRQQANEMFNRGLAGMAASMAPPWENRATILRMGEGLSGPDPGELMGNLMKVQQWQQQQQQLQAFLQSLPDMVKKFQAQGINVTEQELATGGPQMVQDLIKSGMPTPAMITANAAADAYRKANPDATDTDVAQVKSDILAGAVGPQDPATTAWRSAVRVFHQTHPGEALPPEMKDPVTFAGFKTEAGKTAALAAEEKSTATTGFAEVSPTYDLMRTNIAWLKAHPDATAFAIHHPEITGGVPGQLVGGWAVDQNALDARNILDTFGNQQFRAGMQGTKNVRTQQEANKIGGSMTSLDKRTNSDKAITDELERLDATRAQSYATLKAAAGQPLLPGEKDLADKAYTDPTSPYYNYGPGGVKEAKPAADAPPAAGANQPVTTVKTPADVARLPKGTRFVIPDGSGRIGVAPGG